jgi:hypothetical protein
MNVWEESVTNITLLSNANNRTGTTRSRLQSAPVKQNFQNKTQKPRPRDITRLQGVKIRKRASWYNCYSSTGTKDPYYDYNAMQGTESLFYCCVLNSPADPCSNEIKYYDELAHVD